MSETPPDTPKRSWLKPLLFASLALNLLIAGVVLGSMLSPDGPNRRGESPARGVVGDVFFRALPSDERRALTEDVQQNRERIRESREDLRARFSAFLTALRADPFNPAEIERLLQEQRKVAVRRQEIGEELLLKRLTEMTTEQRAAYADKLENTLRKFKRR